MKTVMFKRRAIAALHRRVGSASARYRLALSSGFILASIGMATMVIGQSGRADDFFSAFGSLFSLPQPAAPASSGPLQGEVRRAPHRVRYASDDMRRGRSHAHHGERPQAARDEDGSHPHLGRASMCVRLCDGFAFPVGDFHGEGDIAAHEATCRSECPGARTALYVMPNGGSSIDEAVEAHSGHAYSEQASGFHYTTFIDQSCSCHPEGGNRIASLLRDFTLRRGDAVVTASGVKVFHGGGHYPYRQADFVRLAQSRDVQKTARASFRDIERAGIQADRPAVAQAARPPVPEASVAPREHQASLAPAVASPATP